VVAPFQYACRLLAIATCPPNSTWSVCYGTGTLSYVATTPTTSVNELDLGPLADDAVSRGYMTNAWYLIDVEAGFEVWQGGAGLTANSFSVTVNG
jgi:Glycosyl hydrolase family 12